MNTSLLLLLGFIAGQFLLPVTSGEAAQRRATRLGNPATRFAPPLVTAEDLRDRFRDAKLKPDIAEIVRQAGWRGNLEDLHQAALTGEITEVQLPIGYVMPFMSSREHGRPVCLFNLVWAGKEPIPAFAFTFTSNARRYRCVTPKACSNFFLEDLGDDIRRGLMVDCDAPAQVLSGRPVKICVTVRNNGNVPEPKAIVWLPTPAGMRLVSATGNGAIAVDGVRWESLNLAPNATRQVCAIFSAEEPGTGLFSPSVSSADTMAVQNSCETKIVGVPAILLETQDDPDPIQVGETTTYTIRVTNQGTANGTQIRLVCRLAAGQEFVSATGATPAEASGGVVTMDILPSLAPKDVAAWQVVVKAVKAGDNRFKAELSSDQFELPITHEESTHQY